MSFEELHARVQGRIWQAIAQSDLDIKGLDKKTLESLVSLTTEAALVEMDGAMAASLKAETSPKSVEPDFDPTVGDETILWEGRPFLSLTLHYTITDERVRVTEGLLGKSRENIELIRIQDVDYSQTFSERLLNLGDISVRSHDTSHPHIVLKNVTDPEQVYEILRRAVLNARKRHNLSYREEM